MVRYDLKDQGKYVQPNDFLGRWVPIKVIENEIGLRRYEYRDSEKWKYGGYKTLARAPTAPYKPLHAFLGVF